MFEQRVEVITVVALGDNAQLLAAIRQEGRQVQFIVLDEGRKRLTVNAPHGHAIAHGPKHRNGKRDPAFAFLAPVQRRIACQGRLVEHLQGASTVDPHQGVFVLRHARDQQWQQLIDDALALFRSFENRQRGEIPQQPDHGFLGLRHR